MAVVNSIPIEKPVLFLPDVNLGNWVKKQTGRENMTIWQGACIVHATFPGRRLAAARSEHPLAVVAAHIPNVQARFCGMRISSAPHRPLLTGAPSSRTMNSSS